MFGSLVLLLHLQAVVSMKTNVVMPNCKSSQKVCMIGMIVVERRETMTLYSQDIPEAMRVVEKNGMMHKKTACDKPETMPLTEQEMAYVNFGDGTHKYITTLNGDLPGPTIVVYEGQRIHVNFKNKLLQEGVAIHWHGQHQVGTNFMDGVPGLTQCPINPGETFTYSFKARPVGTHWYHSHRGLQRADGTFGALIVLPRPGSRKDNDKLKYDKEFVMMVNDFYPLPMEQMFRSKYYDVENYLYEPCMPDPGRLEDGAKAGQFAFYSALINGKGRRYDMKGKPIVRVPHEVFHVKPNKIYKFRLISTGNAMSLKVSIDGHPLTITHSENGPIEHQVTDSVVVSEAERWDFYIKTNMKVDNYWIRVTTVEKDLPSHYTLGVLKYEGAPDKDPMSKEKKCTKQKKCTVVNCLGRLRPNSICINAHELRSMQKYKPTTVNMEHILSMGDKIDVTGAERDGLNGILHLESIVPPTILGHTDYENQCKVFRCLGEKACRCTNHLDIKLDDTVQLTLFAKGSRHPMHVHGHSFRVLKMGYPDYDSNGKKIDHTKEIVCIKGDCNNPRWKNESWKGDDIPGLNLKNPIIKDTVTIPAGGYVIVRFVANNPGWWFFHCHIDIHIVEGMAMVFQVGQPEQMKLAPKHFHLCGSVLTPKPKKRKAPKKPNPGERGGGK